MTESGTLNWRLTLSIVIEENYCQLTYLHCMPLVSMANRRSDRRTILTEAADRLVYRRGYCQTTLSDIAKEADIPLGNVYYYFKTKDDIGHALIDHRATFYRGLLALWNKLPDPKERVAFFLQSMIDNRETLTQSGCAIGSLCQELHKEGGPLADGATRLFAEILDWLEAQFQLLDKGRESRQLAVHVVAVLQGAILLSHTFKSPEPIEDEAQRLKDQLFADFKKNDNGKFQGYL